MQRQRWWLRVLPRPIALSQDYNPPNSNGNPLQYSCLENLMGGGAWKAAVHGVAEGHTWLSDFTFTFHFHFSLSCTGEGNGNPLQCSCLENPREGEPGGLPSLGSHSRTRLTLLSSSSSSSSSSKVPTCNYFLFPRYSQCMNQRELNQDGLRQEMGAWLVGLWKGAIGVVMRWGRE